VEYNAIGVRYCCVPAATFVLWLLCLSFCIFNFTIIHDHLTTGTLAIFLDLGMRTQSQLSRMNADYCI